MSYELLKWIHVLSAFLLFGTGLGSAYYKFMADLNGEVAVQAVVNRHVVLADWLFTTPAVIIQPITGWLLLQRLGYTLFEPWVIASFALYALAGICWLPVVWMQIRMREMAAEAHRAGTILPSPYHTYQKIWFILGWPAFLSLVLAVYLMIAKPDLWGG